jgi:hypothetical protein
VRKNAIAALFLQRGPGAPACTADVVGLLEEIAENDSSPTVAQAAAAKLAEYRGEA